MIDGLIGQSSDVCRFTVVQLCSLAVLATRSVASLQVQGGGSCLHLEVGMPAGALGISYILVLLGTRAGAGCVVGSRCWYNVTGTSPDLLMPRPDI
jgi:hypothetical protein